jgi:gamma-glutamyltranspeptidase
MNMIDFGMNLQEAGDARFGSQFNWFTTCIAKEKYLESGFDIEIRKLMQMGHKVGFGG